MILYRIWCPKVLTHSLSDPGAAMALENARCRTGASEKTSRGSENGARGCRATPSQGFPSSAVAQALPQMT